MSNGLQRISGGALVGRHDFREAVSAVVKGALVTALGDEEGAKRAVRFQLAFQSAAQANPQILNINPDKVGRALAMCLMADLAPGGHHPEVWLIPKGGDLLCWLAPHGLRTLARRAGAFLQEIPVWRGDEAGGELAARTVAGGGIYVPKPHADRRSLADLVGFYVVVRDELGARVEWLSQQDIMQRRNVASTKSIWDAWPIEMARKTALKYAFNRGMIATERPASVALSMETEQEIREAPPPPSQSERAARMGLPPAQPDTVDVEVEDGPTPDDTNAAGAEWLTGEEG